MRNASGAMERITASSAKSQASVRKATARQASHADGGSGNTALAGGLGSVLTEEPTGRHRLPRRSAYFRLTPVRPSEPVLKAMPARSRAPRIAAMLCSRTPRSPGVSTRRTVENDTPACSASCSADQPR